MPIHAVRGVVVSFATAEGGICLGEVDPPFRRNVKPIDGDRRHHVFHGTIVANASGLTMVRRTLG